MKSLNLTLVLFFIVFAVHAQTSYVRISTAKGDMIVMLYDETPQHRDNFLKAIRTGMFRGMGFNRVIKNFVSQGGELDETILNREKAHPEQPIKRVPAEINPKFFHKKGALGAGSSGIKTDSYLDQIYLTEGEQQTDKQLDSLEAKTGRKFTAAQREIYKTIGGTPQLDGDYTLFGEIYSGIEVAADINKVETDKHDLPLAPINFTLHILDKQEILQLIKRP